MQCVIVRCSVLQCIALCCAHASLLCGAVLQCVAVSCSELECIAACCTVLQGGFVCIGALFGLTKVGVLQCVEVCCIVDAFMNACVVECRVGRREKVAEEARHTLLHTATHCNTLQLTATRTATAREPTRLLFALAASGVGATHTAIYYDTLQHIATCCNSKGANTTVVGANGLLCWINKLQRTVTHCNTLQDTATHCNTLQDTATHCNSKGGVTSISLSICCSHCVAHV